MAQRITKVQMEGLKLMNAFCLHKFQGWSKYARILFQKDKRIIRIRPRSFGLK